jgi:hypothetical protein
VRFVFSVFNSQCVIMIGEMTTITKDVDRSAELGLPLSMTTSTQGNAAVTAI